MVEMDQDAFVLRDGHGREEVAVSGDEDSMTDLLFSTEED